MDTIARFVRWFDESGNWDALMFATFLAIVAALDEPLGSWGILRALFFYVLSGIALDWLKCRWSA